MEYVIIGIIALIVFLMLLLVIKVEALRNRANALFLEAEKNITEDKFNYVCDNLYKYIPNIVQLFISEDSFRNIVQVIYDHTRELAKDLLNDGKRNHNGEE